MGAGPANALSLVTDVTTITPVSPLHSTPATKQDSQDRVDPSIPQVHSKDIRDNGLVYSICVPSPGNICQQSRCTYVHLYPFTYH